MQENNPMRIQFDLPDPAAELLLRLINHIRQHTGTEPAAAAVCRSMIVDLLVDDAIEHGIVVSIERPALQ
jgi:hypothetical protein